MGLYTHSTTTKPGEDSQSSVKTKSSPKTLTPVHSVSMTGTSNTSPVTPLNSTNSVVHPSVEKKGSALSEGQLTEKIKHLELELAKSESQRLDIQDQVQILEEKLKSAGSQSRLTDEATDLSETIHAKDQYIVKLEKDLKTLQTESTTMRLKLKRRIKALTNQLHEVRQEASINQMELKSEIAQCKEKLKSTGGQTSGTSTEESFKQDGSHSPSHSKVIVELSNQLSEQSERISTLETQVKEKDAFIQKLQAANGKPSRTSQVAFSKTIAVSNSNVKSSPNSEDVSFDRLHSSRGLRNGQTSTAATRESPLLVDDDDFNPEPSSRPQNSRMSTALSDSDSDWGADDVPALTRSAPARVRVKSAHMSQAKQSVTKETNALQGDDDSIMQYLHNSDIPARDSSTSESRTRPHKKSALRNHLEKRKNENQMSSLMGPSIAFANPGHELPSDTSCEPTPRYKDPSRLPGFSKLTVVQASNN
ncbi:uncharacterized protein LOC101854664 isoform X2 [Aplysia californica]|uniref:Uncharacterized protein LOC101854664 isoform X2 n=1 Tax=Aplysia californica TaxID=6500 RepID=A0ABM1VZN8_APLCA|nr:uncharacterized protein LOC101854664 isoform X2 [Aplysia californica]